MAAVEPISSFPMDKEAAEEEIALLVRKPGFDDLNITDIIRHMNNRFNTSFELYKPQLKKMVIDEISKRNQEQNESDSSDDSSGSESDSDEEKEKNKKKSDKPIKKEEKVVKKEVNEEVKEEVNEKVRDSKPPKLSKPPKHDDSDSDSGVDDAEVHKKKPVSDMASTIKSTRRAAASDALKQIRYASGGGRFGSSKKKKEKDPNADHSGKFGPMTKLCYISPELQQVTKDQWMKRCDVVKVMWDYIKDNNLKDPKNGQFVICDDVLQSIFNKNRFKAFGMAKFLTKHIIGINDLVPEMKEAAEAEMEKRRSEWKEREKKRKEEEYETTRVSDDAEEGPSSKKPKIEQDSDDEDDKNGNDDGSSSSSSSDSD